MIGCIACIAVDGAAAAAIAGAAVGGAATSKLAWIGRGSGRGTSRRLRDAGAACTRGAEAGTIATAGMAQTGECAEAFVPCAFTATTRRLAYCATAALRSAALNA